MFRLPLLPGRDRTGIGELGDVARDRALGMIGPRGEIIYLYSVLTEDCPLIKRPDFAGALREVLESVLRYPRFDYLVRDDPMPFVQDLCNAWIAFKNQ